MHQNWSKQFSYKYTCVDSRNSRKFEFLSRACSSRGLHRFFYMFTSIRNLNPTLENSLLISWSHPSFFYGSKDKIGKWISFPKLPLPLINFPPITSTWLAFGDWLCLHAASMNFGETSSHALGLVVKAYFVIRKED